MSPTDPSCYRKRVYMLLIVIAAATAAGHVCSSTRVFDPDNFKDDANPDPRRTNVWPASRPKPTPAFGSNDISRWVTIRALLEEGTYVIGRRYPGPGNDYTTGYTDVGITFEPGNAWRSIDKVLKEQETPDHYKEFYSSKPPLLTTVVAGLCWLLQLLFGWTLKDNTFIVVRAVLLIINIVPFMIYLKLMACLLERRGGTDWGRLFILAAAAFGTLVSPFLVTFNNHTIATWCVLFALYPVIHTL
ncbi:MAG TPA: hypothetical protein VE988_12675, partial [Gemmataceae bacterium]|nr:hypothetical protein [Gemmataceae bacterium]